MKKIVYLAAIAIIVFCTAVVAAVPPQKLLIQGRLLDPDGNPPQSAKISGIQFPEMTGLPTIAKDITVGKDGYFSFLISAQDNTASALVLAAMKTSAVTTFNVVANINGSSASTVFSGFPITSVPYAISAYSLNGMSTKEIIDAASAQAGTQGQWGNGARTAPIFTIQAAKLGSGQAPLWQLLKFKQGPKTP